MPFSQFMVSNIYFNCSQLENGFYNDFAIRVSSIQAMSYWVKLIFLCNFLLLFSFQKQVRLDY